MRETIEVKGEAPREVELKFTRHGPVVAVDANKRAFAMRTVWMEPGLFGLFRFLRLHDGRLGRLHGRDASLGRAVGESGLCRREGQYRLGRLRPHAARTNYDGLMPVPGDGRYEWQGFLSLDELPRVYRPEQGWFATANQMNLPDDFPIAERKVGFEWADRPRWQRIVEVLKANSKVTLADAMDLQNDDTSMLARRLVALLKPLSSDDANVKRGLDLMKVWDARDTVDSAAAAIYEVWIANHLGPAVVKIAAPKAADILHRIRRAFRPLSASWKSPMRRWAPIPMPSAIASCATASAPRWPMSPKS